MIKTERDRMARGPAYVLKTSLLERALLDAALELDVHLNYWTHQSGGSILQAFYWMPNQRVPHRRVYVRAGSVPSTDRRAAARLLEDQGLPAFIEWLASVHGGP